MGIDDFAFKKGNTYGTIVVDETTHRPVALLNGRDSDTLKEWLKNNRHIKTVTRDRAGAYASALSEVLPDAMQKMCIRDRNRGLLSQQSRKISRTGMRTGSRECAAP